MAALIQTSAYTKIFLHAAKNQSSSVGGYLIGSENNGQFNILDVVPICHSSPCGPIFEISAEMVSTATLLHMKPDFPDS
jgi:Uncharacterised protein family (UPF0172)